MNTFPCLLIETKHLKHSEGMQATESELEQWKQGKKELWYVETAYKIYKCEQVTE